MILFKMGKHGDFYLSFFQIVGAWRDCAVVIKLLESFLRVYMVLGDAVSKYGFEPYFTRSITWSLFTLKASYLVKWPIPTWSFMCWCQFIDVLKFETRPSSLMNFGTANYITCYSIPIKPIRMHGRHCSLEWCILIQALSPSIWLQNLSNAVKVKVGSNNNNNKISENKICSCCVHGNERAGETRMVSLKKSFWQGSKRQLGKCLLFAFRSPYMSWANIKRSWTLAFQTKPPVA